MVRLFVFADAYSGAQKMTKSIVTNIDVDVTIGYGRKGFLHDCGFSPTWSSSSKLFSYVSFAVRVLLLSYRGRSGKNIFIANYCVPLAILSCAWTKPIIYIHEGPTNLFNSTCAFLLRKFQYYMQIVVVSHVQARQLRLDFYEVIHNYVEIPRFNRQVGNKVLWVGYQSFDKGYSHMLEFIRANKSLDFKIVSPEKLDIRLNNVELFNGLSNVEEIYNEVGWLMVSSENETFGLTILEATMLNIPVFFIKELDILRELYYEPTNANNLVENNCIDLSEVCVLKVRKNLTKQFIY